MHEEFESIIYFTSNFFSDILLCEEVFKEEVFESVPGNFAVKLEYLVNRFFLNI